MTRRALLQMGHRPPAPPTTALLTAAAPDLFNACELALASLRAAPEPEPRDYGAIRYVRAALKKAGEKGGAA